VLRLANRPEPSPSLPVGAPVAELGRRGRLIPVAILAGCLLASLIVGVLLCRYADFWSPDQALRFVQMESLWRQHYRDVAVPYPASYLDPTGRFFPAMEWFHFQREGKQYLSYLPYFPMASAPLFHAFGYPGLLMLPVAAGLAVLWITVSVLGRTVPALLLPGTIALALGTPLMIYSITFWDHILVVAMAAGAFMVVGRAFDEAEPIPVRYLLMAGALLGLGLWLRNEMYVLAIAVVLAWLVAGSGRRLKGLAALVAGLVIPAGILWAINSHLYGTPLGWKGRDLVTTRLNGTIHAAVGRSTAVGWVTDRLSNAYYQLVSPDFYAFSRSAVAAGAALAVGLVLAGLLIRTGVRRHAGGLVLLGGVVSLFTSLGILSGRTMVSGLLPSMPFVILVLLPGPLTRRERFLWLTIGFFVTAIIVTGTHGGLQWGPRYLLPIVPALVWLGALAAGRARTAAPSVWPRLRLVAGGLIIVSALIQVSGVDQGSEATARNAHINAALRTTSAGVIVTPLDWLTMSAGSVYFEKVLMLVRTPQDFHALVEDLSQKRVARWTYIPYSGTDFGPSGVEKWVADRPWRFKVADDQIRGGLRFVTFVGLEGGLVR